MFSLDMTLAEFGREVLKQLDPFVGQRDLPLESRGPASKPKTICQGITISGHHTHRLIKPPAYFYLKEFIYCKIHLKRDDNV